MENCIFCKIVKKEIPADIVYEDDEILSFLDVNPVNHGHLLVIPKSHYRWMYEVPDALLSNIFIKSKNIMIKLKETTKCDFIVEAVVGVDVPHFHVHLVPRYFNDGMANFWPTKKYKKGEDKVIADKIKQSFFD